MNEVKIIPVEAGNKIALPAEWAAELHLAQTATLEKLPDGILVRPKRISEMRCLMGRVATEATR